MGRTEDQIELIDALRVLWKYKLMILAGTFICIITVGIISFTQPKIYRVSMILQPGIIEAKNKPKDYLDTPDNIKAIIKQGIFREAIINYMKTNNPEDSVKYLNFNVTVIRKTDIVKISYDTQNRDTGIKILDALGKALSNFYAEKRHVYLTEYEYELKDLKRQMRNLENSEKKEKQLIAIIQKTLLAENFEETDPSSEKKPTSPDEMKRNDYIENFELIKTLLDARTNLRDINDSKEYISMKIAAIKKMTNEFKYVQILKPPLATKKPIKPNIKINMSVALLSGFLLMILLSFLIEYFRNQIYKPLNKKFIQSTDRG